MTYSEQERARATRWKTSTPALPDGARDDAPYARPGFRQDRTYPFCLPREFAAHNLQADVRELGLSLFAKLGIPWHAGVDGGPSNHLLSSQVQCVNALGRMVHDPERICAAFGGHVDLGDILQIEADRYLTFEYVGPTDFFGEARGGVLTRGANCTSVDAAFCHRARDGATELVLVEWKYTEHYRRRSDQPKSDETRRRRYERWVLDPEGPVRDEVLSFPLLLDEPIYQLVRQQLLAHALETSGEFDRVRVVHVLSPDNLAYQKSLPRPEHRQLGASVSEVWQRLLRHTDRFTTLDPTAFLSPAVTSDEYVSRYGPAGDDPAPAVTPPASTAVQEEDTDISPPEQSEEPRADLSSDIAARMAATLGFADPWHQAGLAQKYFYFADGDRLLIVVGEQSGSDAEKALAYGMTWRGDRRLVLALPATRAFGTVQRIAWFRPDARPTVYTHDGVDLDLQPIERSREETVEQVRSLSPGSDPVHELTAASAPLHLGSEAASVNALTEWATARPDLDPAHRQSYRAWHFMGQSVLQLSIAKGGVAVRAGINDAAGAYGTVKPTAGSEPLDPEQLATCISAVETAIAVRSQGGPLHKPDEHWLQAVLRRQPHLAGVESPAVREVPAWRPSPDTTKGKYLSRGYVDLIGLDGAGDIRVVETKLASADDPMLILQGIDYLIWALAYSEALRARLGVGSAARITLCYLVGAKPRTPVAFSRYVQAQVDALDTDAVEVAFLGLTGWFPDGSGASPTQHRYDAHRLPIKEAAVAV